MSKFYGGIFIENLNNVSYIILFCPKIYENKCPNIYENNFKKLSKKCVRKYMTEKKKWLNIFG
jgi:hypothetical protein